jgi:hypothetical protein
MARSAPPKRLDTSVTDAATLAQATRLMDTLDAGNAELYRAALSVFEWCVEQAKRGRHIMATDESGHPAVELSTPHLDAVRRGSGQIQLEATAFDAIVRILENPAEPTPALRELMASARAD